jgi:tetratricopeptide (TPR) repeat protein
MKTLSYFLLLITGVVLVGCATQTPEQRAAKYVAKGDAKMEQAMDELITADDEYLALDTKDAIKYFNKALDHIDDAVVYYAKAFTTPEDNQAVSALEDGLNELEKCVKAMEDNDSAKALEHYTAAQGYFDKAAEKLWATS